MAGVRVGIRPELDAQGMRSVEMQFNKMMSRLSGRQANFSLNSKSFTQPLGRITASANEFTKSLEASNARVIAFGASVGIINAVTNAFKGLVAETIKFQKVMADINVIMGASQQSIEAFGMALFDTAKNTAQSFNQVAEAALEFSRQGLSMEETLRRTNDALILTRLTSLKAEEAVSGLTAAVNAFGDSGVTTTDIIDKLAAVDVNFAVSSEDLINALERTGAVAIDAGVQLNNLIGIVTSLQQTTARGGSVIGNGLKTIFTRIRRPESIRQLEEMGVQVKNLQGNLLPADKVLQNIAKSFDSLTESQQSNVTQFAAGIFQANIFKSALRDLAKEQNIFERATAIAGDAMGDAAIKNEQLNKTLDALAKRTTVSIEELAEVIGNLTLKGPIGGILENVESAANGIKNALGGGEEAGSTFFKGFVKGIGNVLSGPGLVAFTAVMGKMLLNVGKFASQSLKDVLGVVGRKEKLVQMENSIIDALAQNKQIQEGLNELEGDRLAQEKFMLKVLEAQTNAMVKQKQLAASLAGAALKAGVNPDLTVSTNSYVDLDGSGRNDEIRASGHIPTSAKRKERKGAIEAGYTPGGIASMSISGVGKVVYNKAETVKKFPGMDQPAIMPPRSSRAGKKYEKEFSKKHGFDPYAFKGYVPNFAAIQNDLTTGGQAMELRGLQTGKFKTSEYRKQLEAFIAQNGAEVLQESGIDITFSTQTNQLTGASFKATGGDKSALSLGEYLEALGVKEIETTIPFGYVDDIPRMARKPKVYHKKVLDNLNKGTNEDKGNVGESLFLKSGEGGGYQSTAGLEATDEYGSYTINPSKGKNNFVVDAIKPGGVPFEIKAGEIDLNNVASKSIRRYSNFAFREQVADIANSFVGDMNPNPSVKGLNNDDIAKELNYMLSKLEEDLLVESLAQLARMGSWNPVGLSMSEVQSLLQKNQLQKTLRENPALIDEAAKDLVVSHGISSGFIPNYASPSDVYNKDGFTVNARNEYTLGSGKVFKPHVGQTAASGFVNGDMLDPAGGGVSSVSIPISDLLDPSTVLRKGFPLTSASAGKDFQGVFGDRAYMGDPGGPTTRFDWERSTAGDIDIGPGMYDPNVGINPHVISNVTYGEAARSGASHTATKMLAKANNTAGVRAGLDFMLDRSGGSTVLDVAFPKNAAEFINSAGLDGYEFIGNKINYSMNSDADVQDIVDQGMSQLGMKMKPDWVRAQVFRDYVNANKGLVPNFNALNLKTGYFSEAQIKAAIKTAYERRTGNKISLTSPDIERYMTRYIAAIQDAQADDPEGFITSYTSGDGSIKGEKILFNEISLALEKAGNYYQPKPGETVREDDFSKGLVPNFANLTLYRGQKRDTIDQPTIGANMPSFSEAKTPEDVVGIIQDFVKSHVSGPMSGYRDIGETDNVMPSGATSFSTSKTVAKNFAGSINPGQPVTDGHVLSKTVPEKNVFNKKKMLRILNKGAKPEEGYYPKVEEFKDAMASGAIQKWAEENGGLYLNVYGRRNDRSLLKFNKLEYGRTEYDFYDKTMKQMVPESDIGYNPDGTRQISPREAEVMQIFNKGLVPNFAMSVQEMTDPATGTMMKYRQHDSGYAEILHATRGDKDLKGGAFNNFNELLKNNQSLGSGFLTPQRNGTGSTPWANIVSMFPQIKYRIQEGLQTRGVFGYSEGYDEQLMDFDSLVNFKSDINKRFTKPENADIASLVFKPFGGVYDMDEAINFQDLTTMKVKGKGDAAAGFLSKGLVPNFAKKLDTTKEFYAPAPPSVDGPFDASRTGFGYKAPTFHFGAQPEKYIDLSDLAKNINNNFKRYEKGFSNKSDLVQHMSNSIRSEVKAIGSRYKSINADDLLEASPTSTYLKGEYLGDGELASSLTRTDSRGREYDMKEFYPLHAKDLIKSFNLIEDFGPRSGKKQRKAMAKVLKGGNDNLKSALATHSGFVPNFFNFKKDERRELLKQWQDKLAQAKELSKSGRPRAEIDPLISKLNGEANGIWDQIQKLKYSGLIPNFARSRVERARKSLKSDTKNYLQVTPEEYKQFEDIVEWMQLEFPVSGLRLDKETFSISANTEDIRHIKSVMDNPSVIRNMEKDGIQQPSKLLKSFLKKHTESLLQAKNFQRKGISEGVTSNQLLRGYFRGDEDKYYDVANKGLVPNFNDPLVQAIKREKAAGVPSSRIRIERSKQLVDNRNPLGLAVTNTIDEPLGINQGIRRARKMKMNPKTHGASSGVIPNFAAPSAPAVDTDELADILKDGADKLDNALLYLESKLTPEEFDKLFAAVDDYTVSLKNASDEVKRTGSGDAAITPQLEGSGKIAQEALLKSFQKAEVRSGGDKSVIQEGEEVSKVFNSLASQSGKVQAAIEAETKSRDNGLQRLFFFQSMISMANGFLGEFASTASGATKNLAELGMGASQVFAAYMQQKELIPEITEALGQNADEQRSIGDLFGGNPERDAAARRGEREAVARNLRNQQRGGVRGGIAKLTGGNIPFLGKSLGSLARGFTRFLPIIGQLYTGFTLVNEAIKFFTGEGIFDLMSSSAEKARKQIEELGKTSETVSAALESMKSKEEIQQKMVDLEILGSSRTQKQEQEYYDLRLKSLDADAKLMDSMGALYDENKIGEVGLKAVNKALGGSTEAHAQNKKALQELLVVTKMLTAVESNRVNFSENVDKADSDDNVEKFLRLSEAEGARSAFAMQDLLKGKSGASSVEQDAALQKNISELRKLAANPEMNIDELNFDANELVGSVGIQGMLDNLKKTTDEFEYDMGGLSDNEIKGFAALINKLADNLSKNDISEGQKAIMMADTKFAKELNKLVNLAKTRVSYEKITLNHQLELNKLRREETAASEDLISEYGMMSNATAAFNKVSRDAANQLDALNKKRADAEDELSIAILDQAKTIMSTNLLSPDLKREGDDLAKSIATFNERLKGAANADFEFGEFNSRVITDLNVDDEIKTGVSRIFEGIQIDEGTQFQEKLNEITQRIADEQDPRIQLAATLAAVESGILAVEEETLQKLAEASDKYSQVLVAVDLEAKRQDEKNKQSLKKLLIEAKTVEGAKLLEKELSKTLATQELITENLMGEAATLSVQNKFAAKRLKLEQDSVAFQALIFQNLRKQAIESSKSGMEGLSSSQMSNSLLSSAPSKNQEVLDTQRLLMKNQLIKIGEETASAESAAIEADIRRGMLSDLNMLGKIVADEASAEADNLAIEVQKKALKLSALDNNAKSLETIKSTVQGEMIDLVTTNKTAQIRREIMDKMGYRSIIADQQIEQELSELKDGNKLEKEKLQRLIITGKINEIVSEQVEQEILTAEKSSLINAKKELLLSLNDEMAERMRAAVALEETGNKLKALRNAKEQALIDQPTMDLMVGADVQTEKFQSLGAVRESATRATLTDDPDDILAFAEAYKAYNKEIGNNSEIIDALKVKMAEMNVSASNLKSDLVNLGIDSARSGLKSAFKDIATGAKDIGEAFADVGLGIADTIMDRMMEANIDKIIKDLTFAFTGESAKSDAQMVVDSNTELGNKLEQSSNVEQELASKLESLVGKVESGLTDGVELTNTEKLVANLRAEISGGASDFAAKFRDELKGLFGDKPQWLDAIGGLKDPMNNLKTSLDELKSVIEKKQTEETPSPGSKDKVDQVRENAKAKAQEAAQPKSQDQATSLALKNKVDPFKQSYNQNPYVNEFMQRRNLEKKGFDMSRITDERLFDSTRNKNIDIAKSKLGNIRSDRMHAETMVSQAEAKISSFNAPVYQKRRGGGQFTVRGAGANYEEFNRLSAAQSQAQANFDNQQNIVNDLKLNSDLTNSADKAEYDSAVEKLGRFETELAAAGEALAPLSSQLAKAKEQLELYTSKMNEATAKEKEVQKEVNEFIASDRAVPSGYERPVVAQPATESIANPQAPIAIDTSGTAEVNAGVDQKIQGLGTSSETTSASVDKLKVATQGLVSATNSATNKLNALPSPTTPTEMMAGGKVKKYANGGMVTGPGGIDNVPAMLTAGEYVIPKDVVSEFNKGGKATWQQRLKAGAQGVMNTAASTYGSYAASRSAQKPQEAGPPVFDEKQLQSLDLGFDVSLNANDKMVSSRLAESNAGLQEYEQHLLDLHEYNVGKKNQKFEKRMGTFNQIMGMVGGYVTSGLVSMGTTLASPLIAKGKEKLGGLFKSKEEKMLDQAKRDVTSKAVSDEVDSFIGDLYGDGKNRNQISQNRRAKKHTVQSGINLTNANILAGHNRYSANKTGIHHANRRKLRGYNKGGSVVPAMLTAGESLIPSSVAKKIGYSNLEQLNTSGDIPIVRGQSGIDKVGPVGLNEGDFVIKKSSTDKLMKRNPNLFKMAVQNPDGFRKNINNYYQGGVVSNNRLPNVSAQPQMAPQLPQVQAPQMAPLPEPTSQSGQQSSSTSNVTNNISVNVNIDESGKETSTETGGAKGGANERELSKKIKAAVLDVIRQEKRVGGELS